MPESAGLVLDDLNANKGTERGLGMLEHSLRTFGAARSGVADRHGRVIAGNKTVEAAMRLGIPVRTIESDGRTLFVIKRTDLDLDTPQGRALAVADNRIAEVDLDWDLDVLAELREQGVGLGDFWMPEELDKLLEQAGVPPTDAPPAEGGRGKTLVRQCPNCGYQLTNAVTPPAPAEAQ